MEFKDAVKYLRNKAGMTQAELASTLHTNISAIRRWEKGTGLPSGQVGAALYDFARSNSASKECIICLDNTILNNARIDKQKKPALDNKDMPSKHEQYKSSSLRSKRRILIVDDDASSRIALANIFKNDYLIETAENGEEALLRLQHFGMSISVVLLDLNMPGMGGFAVLKKMQDNVDMCTIPVIVICDDDEQSSLIKAVELGAADYITKPMDFNLTRIRVQSAISKAENDRLRAQNSYLLLRRNEEAKFYMVLESTGTVVIEYDMHSKVFTYSSEITKHIAGTYDHRDLWQVLLSDNIAESADVKMMQDALTTLSDSKDESSISKLVMLKTPSLEKHWFRINIYKNVDKYCLAEKVIITFNDVHSEVLTNEKLKYQATRDDLTGLYNRAGFMEKAAELISAKEPGYYIMSCIDIEKFKIINDQYGTEKGDILLQKFAKKLNQVHHDEMGICCRIAADNFAILYPKYMLDESNFADARQALRIPDESLPPIKYYVGRCQVDDKELTASSLYDRASIAKETIKGRYDVNVATYNESMRTTILRQQEITGQMNSALAEGQFEVWLQPQFNHVTGNLSGAEALVRWRHPEEGIISPAEFISIFESNGFIYEVDKFVWEETCKLLRKWLDQGLKPIPVSVNVSRYDVFRDDFIQIITGLIKKYDLPVELLCLEITESAFSESTDQIIDVVEQLVEYGFFVEIDDFGSGYSSLNTLKDVPAQVLKLDMRFLENDRNSQRGGSIIESIVRMAHWLGMSIIAEGVETTEQADFLNSIGCEKVQGFLYSRPIQVPEYEKLFSESKTESKLGSLQTVDKWNNNAFWNPQSMETLIFNSYVGGACIFEYHGDRVELLRYNKGYADIFGGNFKFDQTDAHNNILSVLDQKNSEMFRAGLDAAINTKNESTCEIKVTGETLEVYLYIRTTVRVIAQTKNRYLFYCVVTDITDQRKAELEKIKSSRLLQAIMDNMTGGVAASIVTDGKINYLFANDKYYELLGYRKDEYNKKFSGDFFTIHPDDIEKTNAVIRKAVKELKPYHVDFRIIHKNGEIRWLSNNINIIRLPDIDQPVHLAAVTDTTTLHEAQRKESIVAKQFQAIMSNIQGGITATVCRSKDEFDILFSNDGFYELYGYTREQFNAEVPNVIDLIVPEDREKTLESIFGVIKNRSSDTYEYRCRKRDGSIMWSRVSYTVVSLDDFGDTVILSVVSDITEARESQQKIAAESEKLQAVLDHAGDGITAILLNNTKFEFIFANDRYFEINGYTREEYKKITATDIYAPVVPEDRKLVQNTLLSLNHSQGRGMVEYRIVKSNGDVGWIRATVAATCLSGYDEPVQIAIFSDITAEKEKNIQLQYLNDSAHDILAQADSDHAIREILHKQIEYHDAERAYVIEIDESKELMFNTYEVCADGIKRKLSYSQAISFSHSDFWYEELSQNKFVVCDSVDSFFNKKTDVYKMLVTQDITSIILSPLWRDGVMIGFVGVDNPKRVVKFAEWLLAMGDYIAVLLTRRDLSIQVERSHAALNQLINDTPGGFCRMEIYADKNPELVTFNTGFCNMLEMTEDEVRAAYGEDMYKCLNTDDFIFAMVNPEEQHFKKGQFKTKCRLRKKDGSEFMTMVFGRFIYEDGHTYLNSYFSDIAEQHEADELIRGLMDKLSCGAALFEFDGEQVKAIHINRSYWRLVERSPINNSNAKVIDSIHPDDKSAVMQELSDCIRLNRDFSCNFRVIKGDNSYLNFHVTATLDRAKNGNYLLYTTYTPISEADYAVIPAKTLKQEQNTIVEAVKDKISSENDLDKPTILLVDDNAVERAILAGILKSGYNTVFASSGEEAIDFLNHTRKYISAIVLDVMMPGMDGFETMKALRATSEFAHIPIIVVSSLEDNETREKVISCGAKGFVIKPYSHMLLVHAVENAVRLRDMSAFAKQISTDELSKQLLDTLPFGAAMYEYNGSKLTVIHINKSYWKLVQRNPVDFSKVSIFDAIYPDDVDLVKKEIASAIQQKRNIQIDVRILCRADEYLPFHIVANVMPEQSGKYIISASYMPISDSETSLKELIPIILSAMMSNSEDIAYVKDKDGKYIACSNSAFSLFKKSEGEIVGKSDFEIFKKDIAEKFLTEDELVFRTARPLLDRTLKLSDLNGESVQLSISKYPLLDKAGSVIGIYGFSRDITNEKNIEFELKTLLNAIPSGVLKYSADEKEEFAYVNRNFIESLGYTEENFRTKFKNCFNNIICHEDRERVEQELLTQEANGQIGKFDFRIETAGGELRWFHNECVKVTDNSGKAWYYVVLVDVDEQKKTESYLRLAEEEYRIATQHSGHIIGRYDVRKKTLKISPESAKKLGLSECIEDVPYGRVKLGKISEDTISAYIEFYENILNGKKEGSVTFKKLLPKGGWRWITEHSTTLFDDNGMPISAIITFIDVTDQYERESIYRKWQQEITGRDAKTYTLYRINLNKNESYDMVAGDLFSFRVNEEKSVSFNEQLLDFAKENVSLEDREAFIKFSDSDTLIEEYKYGKNENVLEFRRIADNCALRWTRLGIELVEYPDSSDIAAYLMFEDIHAAKSLELEIKRRAESDPLTSLLNRNTFEQRVNQVLDTKEQETLCAVLLIDMDGFKLINDRLGHSTGDQVLIKVGKTIRSSLRTCDFASRMGGDEFLIFLNDMPNEETILKKSKQICNLVQNNFKLEIEVTASIGISVAPDDGFDFAELYKKADKALYHVKANGKDNCAMYKYIESESPLVSIEKSISKKGEKKKKVLIVEDSSLNQVIMENILKNDYEIHKVSNGQDALIWLRREANNVDVILLDLIMPVMDGISLLEQMRASDTMKKIPVIVVSGQENRDVSLSAIRAGAADYVTKPVDPSILRLRIKSVIDNAKG